MANYLLSLNQFADFSGATDAARRRIIKQQISPNPFLIPWYQLPKAKMKKCIELKGDLKPIYNGISTLMNRVPKNQRQRNDRLVSIEVLERFIRMRLPDVLTKMDYEIIKPASKTLTVSDVEIKVAPELIVKGVINGKTVIGAIKMHISKSKPFDYQKSVYVASIICKYLKEHVAKEDELVLPELCFSLDIFGERIVPAPSNLDSILREIEDVCLEVKKLWNAA